MAKTEKDLLYESLTASDMDKAQLRELLKKHTGESNSLDFKEVWPSHGKLAKLMLSMANSGGGLIIFGVKEHNNGSFEPIGLNSFSDKAEVDDSIKKFIPATLHYEIKDYEYDDSVEYNKLENKKFQTLSISDEPQFLPFISTATDGRDIKSNMVYVRKGTKCELATHEEFELIINRRIDTKYSSTSTLNLREHLEQLKLLFAEVQKGSYRHVGLLNLVKLFGSAFDDFRGEFVPNEKYPKEDYDDFIIRVIDQKKRKIERVLDL